MHACVSHGIAHDMADYISVDLRVKAARTLCKKSLEVSRRKVLTFPELAHSLLSPGPYATEFRGHFVRRRMVPHVSCENPPGTQSAILVSESPPDRDRGSSHLRGLFHLQPPAWWQASRTVNTTPNFIDRDAFESLLCRVRRVDGRRYEDTDTIYGDVSRLIVAWLAATPAAQLHQLYRELGWVGPANIRPIRKAATKWMKDYRP